ncbi:MULTISPECIES: hypothetical protein [Winogradskyella]|uniref:Outer membrane protein beta-barrel domain-containing protein n=1 Tax=Winogradskyella ouciana TaxID=2608631 RepID=A0A7K1GB61_9FLAO|nr:MULTISPECIES: hypothetical protein [Winogradskyella]MBO6881110.1 hypothetical protein [Winogradskyella sp.]MTE26527.1 hypothetical protein [Winogradskyella ouciana]
MKKLTLLLILVSFSLSSNAQKSDNEWFASVGLNAINSLGSQSPIYRPGDWANGIPISLAVEVGWTTGFSIEQAFTVNKFSEDDEIDGADLKQDYTYTSFDTHVKYYFGKHIFPDADWLDFYGNAGVGFFSIDNTNVSANLGGGVLVWLNRRQTIGIRGQVIGKFALNHKESGLDNNHYQTHLQVIFAL